MESILSESRSYSANTSLKLRYEEKALNFLSLHSLEKSASLIDGQNLSRRYEAFLRLP